MTDRPCPHVVTTDEGTSFCALAEDTVRRLTAERDAARAEVTRLREALTASLDHCKTWHGDCCPCDRGPGGDDFCTEGATVDEIVAAATPPTDQGEGT